MWRFAALLFSISLAASAAAPELTELEPRGAQRGKSFTLTIVGKNLPEGAKVLSNLPALFTPLTPPEEKMAAGRKLPFLVELKADAAVGTYPDPGRSRRRTASRTFCCSQSAHSPKSSKRNPSPSRANTPTTPWKQLSVSKRPSSSTEL